MFDLKARQLMFLDPTDLIINNINKFLSSKKPIKVKEIKTTMALKCCWSIFILNRKSNINTEKKLNK